MLQFTILTKNCQFLPVLFVTCQPMHYFDLYILKGFVYQNGEVNMYFAMQYYSIQFI